ncbi:MAG: hypothetical protein DRH12_01165 [Deltaproteobacteria bacterium]|nr:MAG: hypothetical protein DRH12_01165 [Deltaproteobacteria bacterium]RLB76721.1 MAG: hypothetical protein DRH15_12250 [Deltaproteobacteria bacterium]
MKSKGKLSLKLNEKDLEFLVESASPEVSDKTRLKQIISEDEDFRNTFISDEKVFRRVMDDREIFLKISPALFFEILLRRAARDLEEARFTVEKSGMSKIPIFDTQEIAELMSNESLVTYLADMLSSFIKTRSYRLSFRAKPGVWRKITFSDLDIHTLMSFSEAVSEAHRLRFYKRIADICLFILGMFPEYAEREYRYPFSGQLRPQIQGKLRISPQQYEEEGKKFYRLAAEYEETRNPTLADVFWELHGNFRVATKPLNVISEKYLHYKKERVFGRG